jgi:hypothetical protein
MVVGSVSKMKRSPPSAIVCTRATAATTLSSSMRARGSSLLLATALDLSPD